MKVALKEWNRISRLCAKPIAAMLALSLAACGGGSASGNATLPAASTVGTQSIASNAASLTASSTTQTNDVDVYFDLTSHNSAPQIDNTFVGLSFEMHDLGSGRFDPNDTTFTTLLRTLGNRYIRIGGHSGDTMTWTGSDSCAVPGVKPHDVVCPAKISQLKAFLDQVGWQVIFMLPLQSGVTDYHNDLQAKADHTKTQHDIDVDFAPVRDEAIQASNILGDKLLAFEVGNEPDFYGADPAKEYGPIWDQYVSRIEQAVSRAKFMTPSTADATQMQNYITTGSASDKNVILTSQHLYGTEGSTTASQSEMLADSQLLLTDAHTNVNSNGDNAIKENLNADRNIAGHSFRIAETNSAARGGIVGVSNSFTSALWAVDYLFSLADLGSSGANFHSSGTTDFYAPIPWGIASSLTTVSDWRNVAAPEFYGLMFFNQAAVGGSVLSPTAVTVNSAGNSTGDTSKIEARAIYVNGNQYNLVLVNKDPNVALSARVYLPVLNTVNSTNTAANEAQVDVAHYKPTLTLLSVGAGNSKPVLALATTGITLGGSSVASDGSWTPTSVSNLPVVAMGNPGSKIATSFRVVIPPMSAGLVKIHH